VLVDGILNRKGEGYITTRGTIKIGEEADDKNPLIEIFGVTFNPRYISLLEEVCALEELKAAKATSKKVRQRACQVNLCPVCRSTGTVDYRFCLFRAETLRAKCRACGYKELFLNRGAL